MNLKLPNELKQLIDKLAEPQRQAPATCDADGCSEMNLTRCELTAYQGDVPLRYWLRESGLVRGLAKWLHLHLEGYVVYEPEYYCWAHAREEGFCPGCGQFWAGCEDFDFSPTELCPNCRDEVEEYLDDFDDDYDYGPWDD